MSEIENLIAHFKSSGVSTNLYKFIQEVEKLMDRHKKSLKLCFDKMDRSEYCRNPACTLGKEDCIGCVDKSFMNKDEDDNIMSVLKKDIDAGIKKLVSKDNINDGGVIHKEQDIKSNDTYMLRVEGKSNDTYMLKSEGKTLASIVNKLAIKIQDFEIAAEARIFGEQLDE